MLFYLLGHQLCLLGLHPFLNKRSTGNHQEYNHCYNHLICLLKSYHTSVGKCFLPFGHQGTWQKSLTRDYRTDVEFRRILIGQTKTKDVHANKFSNNSCDDMDFDISSDFKVVSCLEMAEVLTVHSYVFLLAYYVPCIVTLLANALQTCLVLTSFC